MYVLLRRWGGDVAEGVLQGFADVEDRDVFSLRIEGAADAGYFKELRAWERTGCDEVFPCCFEGAGSTAELEAETFRLEVPSAGFSSGGIYSGD